MFDTKKLFKDLKDTEDNAEKRLNTLETAQRSLTEAVIQTAYVFQGTVNEGTTTTTGNVRTENIPSYARGVFLIVEHYSGSSPYQVFFRPSGTTRTDYDPFITSHSTAAASQMIMVELATNGKIDIDVLSAIPAHAVDLAIVAVGYWT